MTTFPKLLKLLRKTPKNLRIRFVAQPLELRNTSAMNKFDLPLRMDFLMVVSLPNCGQLGWTFDADVARAQHVRP